MRKIQSFNHDWFFSKDQQSFSPVTIPHTWNAEDGADGGNDYYRGKCIYTKKFQRIPLEKDEEVYLEFCGVNQSAKVFLNDTLLGVHLGGYSRFRFSMTEQQKEENTLVVEVDNSYRDDVYPQRADFTFYGGIYRDVNLIIVPREHFSLSYYGSRGIKVTPHNSGDVEIEAFFENISDGECRFEIEDTKVTTQIRDNYANAVLHVEQVHLWNGVKDPYLYQLKAIVGEDCLYVTFGFREFKIDPNQGFLLNGISYPLNGVARHQDRMGLGCALSKEHHLEDMNLIKSIGANTIRLAHYQHDEYIYELADQYGFILWAEIPYITEHLDNGVENTLSQMKELIVQNYNHPSIITWGLSNEITTVGGVSDAILENHRLLNDLAHRLDCTRPTTMANLFMLETDSPLLFIPDIRSYNLYYGWYVGAVQENDEWFDTFHKEHPNMAIGLSEYGADANPQFHSETPQKGDYSVSYQALYHEHMLKMREKRPYIWAMYVWNMFDFAADARMEGGKPGINQKGLVTFDRKVKKDAFYLYKAYWSSEPFVHICEKQFEKRTRKKIQVKVYSNQKEVSLYHNGKLVKTKVGDKVFLFDLTLKKGLFAKNHIEVKSSNFSDNAHFKVVRKECQDYIYPDFAGSIKNWFEEEPLPSPDGYFSIYDKVGDIKATPEGQQVFDTLIKKMVEKYGDVAKNAKVPKAFQAMMDKMTFESLLKMAGHGITREMVEELNKALNQIKK